MVPDPEFKDCRPTFSVARAVALLLHSIKAVVRHASHYGGTTDAGEPDAHVILHLVANFIAGLN
jgi:hypothetical protein